MWLGTSYNRMLLLNVLCTKIFEAATIYVSVLKKQTPFLLFFWPKKFQKIHFRNIYGKNLLIWHPNMADVLRRLSEFSRNNFVIFSWNLVHVQVLSLFLVLGKLGSNPMSTNVTWKGSKCDLDDFGLFWLKLNR